MKKARPGLNMPGSSRKTPAIRRRFPNMTPLAHTSRIKTIPALIRGHNT